MNFIDFARNYDTDKNDLGYIEHIYSKVLPKRDKVSAVLEIGIQNGGSILLWRDYFYNAQITGVDINFCEKIDSQERITQIVDNAYSGKFISSLGTYDVIIDDGPHTLESMCIFLREFPSKLTKNGVLILEDIINTKWTIGLIEILDSSLYNFDVYNMGDKCKTQRLREKWKNGLDVIVVTRR